MRILLATANAHKIAEIREILRGADFQLSALSDFPHLDDLPETGATFEANALQKARAALEATGLPSVADDSGIEVDALGGAPGVYSKRFSEEGTDAANNALLLEKLGQRTDRRARYRCVLAFSAPGFERTVDGRCEGAVGFDPRGQGGFGYDPYFFPDETPGLTMAELTMDQKNAISHRGRAFRHLPEILREWARSR